MLPLSIHPSPGGVLLEKVLTLYYALTIFWSPCNRDSPITSHEECNACNYGLHTGQIHYFVVIFCSCQRCIMSHHVLVSHVLPLYGVFSRMQRCYFFLKFPKVCFLSHLTQVRNSGNYLQSWNLNRKKEMLWGWGYFQVILPTVKHLWHSSCMPTKFNIILQFQDSCPHDNIAIKLCNEILGEPNSFDVRTLCRILNMLELCPTNVATLTDLKVLVERMLKVGAYLFGQAVDSQFSAITVLIIHSVFWKCC